MSILRLYRKEKAMGDKVEIGTCVNCGGGVEQSSYRIGADGRLRHSDIATCEHESKERQEIMRKEKTMDEKQKIERLQERLRAVSSMALNARSAVKHSGKQFVTAELVMEWLADINAVAVLGEHMQTESHVLGE
jgi:hypothetical protein